MEIDDYNTRVLTKHWPYVPKFRDVYDCGAHNLEPVDLIAGGFPCQPFSVAGQRRGEADDRNLWPQMRRIVQELKPRWVLGENVPNITRLYLDTVQADLEDMDYEVWPISLPVAAFAAKHLRHRLFILAYAQSEHRRPTEGWDSGADRQNARRQEAPSWSRIRGQDGGAWGVADPMRWGQQIEANQRASQADPLSGADPNRSSMGSRGPDHWRVEPAVGRMADGFPGRVDRLEGLGNAVSPIVAEFVGRLMMQVEHEVCQQ